MPNWTAFVTVLLNIFLVSCSFCQEKNDSLQDRVDRASKKIAKQQKIALKYKFRKNEEVRWQVEHVASTKAQIAGKHEETSSRTQSTKKWKITGIDSLGNATFVQSIESIEFWQKLGDLAPVSFSTQSGEKAPEEFASAVDKVGKPLAVVTIAPNGKVIDRKSSDEQVNFGVGDICTPLPDEPIAVGHTWFVPTEFDASDENGRRLKLKARMHYELTKVVDQLAIISFRTEVLSPIESDQVRSQLLQKLSNGYIAFDVAKGRISSKEVKWNEKVHEYAGADSFLHYVGKMTEKLLVSHQRQSSKDKKNRSAKASEVKIKRPGELPIIRK